MRWKQIWGRTMLLMTSCMTLQFCRLHIQWSMPVLAGCMSSLFMVCGKSWCGRCCKSFDPWESHWNHRAICECLEDAKAAAAPEACRHLQEGPLGNNKNGKHVKCTASEGLSLMPLLACFMSTVLTGARAGVEKVHARCCLLCVHVVELLLRSAKEAVSELEYLAAASAFLKTFCELYGPEAMVPKFHYVMQLGKFLSIWKLSRIASAWKGSIG